MMDIAINQQKNVDIHVLNSKKNDVDHCLNLSYLTFFYNGLDSNASLNEISWPLIVVSTPI